jgi:FixJ family two-component response regulator
VFRLILSGMLNKQVAGELNIAEHTVKLHRQSISEKLGVKSIPEMIHIAQTAGFS